MRETVRTFLVLCAPLLFPKAMRPELRMQQVQDWGKALMEMRWIADFVAQPSETGISMTIEDLRIEV